MAPAHTSTSAVGHSWEETDGRADQDVQRLIDGQTKLREAGERKPQPEPPWDKAALLAFVGALDGRRQSPERAAHGAP